MKERPIPFSAPMVRAVLDGTKTQTRRVLKGRALEWISTPTGFSPQFIADAENRMCPYGQPGDRLWVREAWRSSLAYELTPPRDIPVGSPIFYQADGAGSLPHFNAGKLRPGMFMPRWASRLTLEITDVRVERLQEISRGDAMAEGCPFPNMAKGDDPRKWYADLWEQINGAGSWATNPWVWCVSFKVVKP